MQVRLEEFSTVSQTNSYNAAVGVRSERLREARLARRLSQGGLAEKVGTTQATISRLERGETKDADAPTRKKLVAVLGVPEEELFDDGPEPAGIPAPPAPAAARRELTVERDPVSPVPVPEDASKLERAVGAAFDPARHLLRDALAVLEALRTVHRLEATESDIVAAARTWLDAAAAMRREGQEVTPGDLLLRATVGKTRRAREADESAADAITAGWRAEAEAAGLTPDPTAAERMQRALGGARKKGGE